MPWPTPCWSARRSTNRRPTRSQASSCPRPCPRNRRREAPCSFAPERSLSKGFRCHTRTMLGSLRSVLLGATALAAVSLVAAAPASADGTRAELPRVFLDTHYVPPSGKIIRVQSGEDLQAALDA